MTPIDHITKGPSYIERLDPRVKFFSLLLLGFQTFAFKVAISLLPATLVVFVVVIVTRIPISKIMKRLSSVSVFVLIAVGLNMFTVSGQVLFEFAGLYATREGLFAGALLSARIMLLVLAATVFVETTSVSAMIDGIEAMLKPASKHLGAIVQVLTIALNFVPLLIQSARQIKNAQIVRGANPDKNFIRQLRFAVSATVPLFAMALRSSENLALAMESRCYDPRSERSYYKQLKMKSQDWFTAAIMLAQFLVSIVIAV